MPPRLAAAATAAARALAALLALGWLAWLAIGGHGVLAGAAAALASAPAIAIVAAALAAGAALARAGHAPARLLERVPPRAFGAAVFAIALGSGLWAHEAVHKGVPDVPDELGYLHQARTFADGHLVAPSPPVPEHHYVSWGTHDASGWYAVFPPGYGALLALGELAGAPGAVNPLLGALLALVVWLLARELFGGDTAAARAAALLYLGSWFRLMNAGSFMSHPAAALFGALAVLGLWRGIVRRPRPGDRARAWAAGGGAALACLAATRPLDAIAIAAAVAPALGWAIARDRAPAARRLALAAACALPIATAYLAYNRALTGDALLPPQQRYMQLKERRADCFRLGFGPGVGECPITQNTNFGPDGFQPRHAVVNTHRRLEAWSRWSFGWAPLALLPILALAGAALRGGAAARRRALCGGVLAATVAGYALFFYHGVAYGARFYYVALPFACLLGAAGCADLGAALARRGRRGALVAGALGLALPAVIAVAMWRDRAAVEEHCGRRPALENGALARRLAEPSLAHALVFVDSMKVPAAVTAHPAEIDRNRPLVVKDLGDAANAGFARLYPDREPMRLAGGRLVPLAYARTAPMRHEGGALYPLERAAGGFGRRVPAAQAGGLPLSAGEALRFDAEGPARLAFPVWALAADAGPMTLALRLAHHPRGAVIAVRIDGAAAPALAAHDTAAPAWSLATVEIPVVLAPGRHWVELELPAARRGQAVVLDYAELRPRR